jgi:hypothetical protein
VKRDTKLCYFQGCTKRANTKEHIPPKSFFPEDQRKDPLTVESCEDHNTAKSSDDMYVLAHICMNSAPTNRSRDIFKERVGPQLGFNNDAFRKTLVADAIVQSSGSVLYKVDTSRLDRFFSALSFGIIYKACNQSLPTRYRTNHVYHNLQDPTERPEQKALEEMLSTFYSGKPLEFMEFGEVKALNTSVYSVKIFGVPDFGSSITIVHEFFGTFKVTSMLSQVAGQQV